MKQYFNTRTRISSLFSGGLTFLLAFMCLSAWEVDRAAVWALLIGAGATLLFSVLTPFNMYMHDKRYAGIEETLPKPVLLKASVSIRGKNRPRDGYLYLTEDAMYLFSRDRKPYASQELPKGQIRDLKVERDVFMSFRFANTALYQIASVQCEEIMETMREHGWNVF